ncbi:MAG: HAMP domain-containing histidine kinase, partial [Muribaculaceae bacterium]|nr:HAMP domain-containing histidine kinase [Muribaculaceae bacterium]
MATTFLGLLFAQILYMRSMLQMRNEQFSEAVHRSMSVVADRIQHDETKFFYDEDMLDFEEASQVITQYQDGGVPVHNGVKNTASAERDGMIVEVSVTMPVGQDSINPLTNPATEPSSIEEVQYDFDSAFDGQYRYHKRIIDEIILNIIAQASNRRLSERVNIDSVQTQLREQLTNNGINLPFELAVIDKTFKPQLATKGYKEAEVEVTDTFVQPLFPFDPSAKKVALRVVFPDRNDYVMTPLKFMIPAFGFTLVLLVVFIFTITTAFRQKKLNEMKNDFINNMTHEFKTPISSISLAAQMLNDDSVRKSPTMMQHIATVINDETKRLRFQVEKVLQMSMFDRQKASLRLTEIDANTAISNIVNTFKLKVERYGGRLTCNLDAPDAIVNVDEMHFTNVIFNLLDNAVKYRRDDVPLDLKVTTTDVSGDKLQIVVADNGIGIRKDDLKKIFEKFYRVSTGNRHDVNGFGLGLAYVHKMIT